MYIKIICFFSIDLSMGKISDILDVCLITQNEDKQYQAMPELVNTLLITTGEIWSDRQKSNTYPTTNV